MTQLENICQRMDSFQVAALADEIEKLGANAVTELRALSGRKHLKAVWDGRAYIRPDVAKEMAAIEAVTRGLNWSKKRKSRFTQKNSEVK